MDGKKLPKEIDIQEQPVEVGENRQERILDRSPRHDSDRHRCKGRHCDTAFEKL